MSVCTRQYKCTEVWQVCYFLSYFFVRPSTFKHHIFTKPFVTSNFEVLKLYLEILISRRLTSFGVPSHIEEVLRAKPLIERERKLATYHFLDWSPSNGLYSLVYSIFDAFVGIFASSRVVFYLCARYLTILQVILLLFRSLRHRAHLGSLPTSCPARYNSLITVK